MKIPQSVDALLSELSHLDTLSPALRRRLDPIFIRLLRAFDQSPPNDEILNKVVQRIRECLTPAPGEELPPGDAAAAPVLLRLIAEIDRHRGGTGPSSAPPASARLPLPVAGPPASARRPLPVREPPAPPAAPPPAPVWIERDSSPRHQPLSPPEPAPRAAEPRRHNARPGPRPPVPATHFPEADPATGPQTAGALLQRLAVLHDRRAALLRDPLTAWGALRAVDTEMDRLVRSLRWMAAPANATALAALDGTEDDGERFAATAALLVTGAGDTTLDRALQTPWPVPPYELPAGPWLAFRLFAPADLLERGLVSPHAGAGGHSGELRATLLAGLVDRGQLPPDRLWPLLEDPSDTVAVFAAETLAWLGQTRTDTTEMEARTRVAVGPRRLSAASFAAVALGSAKALQSVRLRLDTGEPVSSHAIDALAIGGDGHADDGQRLLDLAARAPELAERALLAAGHLGDPVVVPTLLPALVARDSRATRADTGDSGHGRGVGGDGHDADSDASDDRRRAEDVRARAARTIRGASPGPEVRPGRRFLYGAPWTLAGLLDRLTDPLELLWSRRWYALEGFARAGGRPVAVLDPRAAASHQERAAAETRTALTNAAAPPAGTWSFRGRP